MITSLKRSKKNPWNMLMREDGLCGIVSNGPLCHLNITLKNFSSQNLNRDQKRPEFSERVQTSLRGKRPMSFCSSHWDFIVSIKDFPRQHEQLQIVLDCWSAASWTVLFLANVMQCPEMRVFAIFLIFCRSANY